MVNIEIKVTLTKNPKINRLILDSFIDIIKEYDDSTELTIFLKDIPVSKAFAGVKNVQP